MKPAFATRCLGLLLPALLLGCATPPDYGTAVEQAMQGTDFNGAIVLTRKGQVVFERGVGWADREAGRAFTPDTAADGASLAKTFTAAAMQLLVAQGKVSLDDPVAKHLPTYPHKATRVRHIVGHSDGLPDYEVFDAALPPGTLRTGELMLRELVRSAAPPAFEPGTRFEYSNFGFDVAAMVIERASGQPYEAFVRQHFFGPLGMQHSFGRPAFFADWPGPRTAGYRQRGGRWERFEVFDGEAFLGGSNLYFSARDLSRWAMAFAGNRLPAPVMRAALAGARLDDGRPLGLTQGNWYCDEGAKRCHYSGNLNAFYSIVHWDRERDETVAFVSNHTLAPWLCARLERELAAALAGRAPPPRDDAPLQRLTRDAMPTLAGSYRSPTRGLLQLRSVPGRLILRNAHGVDQSVFRVTAEVYYVPGLDLWLGFTGDSMLIRSVQGDERADRIAQIDNPSRRAP